MTRFNWRGAYAIFSFELGRAFRTFFQSIFAPVLTTSLYFIVFGAAIGGQISQVGGVSYGAFIIPGLLLLTLLGETTSNASFGIYMPRFTGTIYELLSAPVGVAETLLGFVGAAAAKSLILAAIILVTASFFVDYTIAHPVLALGFIVLIAAAFALFGFALGVWADGFEKLQIVPMLILQPLTFLGGTFYSIEMLPEPWRSVALVNPIVYLVNGLRWTFTGQSDVNIWVSFGLTLGFLFRLRWRDCVDVQDRLAAAELKGVHAEVAEEEERRRGGAFAAKSLISSDDEIAARLGWRTASPKVWHLCAYFFFSAISA